MPLFASVREAMLDVLFPPTCIGCGSNEWLCDACASRIELDRQGRNVKEFPEGLSLGAYAQPTLRQLVYQLKYGAASCLLPVTEGLWKRWRDEHREAWPWVAWPSVSIVPMPADPTRLRARGFDHVTAMAQAFQRVVVPWGALVPVLQKARKVAPNAELPAGPLRAANVRGAFSLRGDVPSHVILLDDVFTTGATVREAARTLKAAGAEEVVVVTLARG